jgi:hypothetical protein
MLHYEKFMIGMQLKRWFDLCLLFLRLLNNFIVFCFCFVANVFKILFFLLKLWNTVHIRNEKFELSNEFATILYLSFSRWLNIFIVKVINSFLNEINSKFQTAMFNQVCFIQKLFNELKSIFCDIFDRNEKTIKINQIVGLFCLWI